MFADIAKIFTPPYRPKDLYSIFISLFIMLLIPLTALQITSQRDTRSSAATLPGNFVVNISSLTAGGVVSGTIKVETNANATSSSIVSVSLVVDDKVVATNNNQTNTSQMATTFNWDTTKVRNGNRIVKAVALSSLGFKQNSTPLKITVTNSDNQKPTISFIQPSDGAYIGGSTAKIELDAEDNIGLDTVTLEIDGVKVATFNNPPFQYNWNTLDVSAGSHVLKATAVDNFGNTSSAKISIYKGVKSLSN